MDATPARRRLARLARRLHGGLALVCVLAPLPRLAAAQPVIDPVGDFRAAYLAAGNPASPSLDVLGAGVLLNAPAFIFVGVMSGDILPTAGADVAYVYGVNRGGGTARLAAQGVAGANNILFDATVTIRPSGDAVVNLFGLFPQITLPGVVTISENFFAAVVPLAVLPTRGFAPENYTFNLWSRVRTTGPANAEIADFAPDNANFRATTVPEPATVLLVAPGLLAVAAVRRRRAWTPG